MNKHLKKKITRSLIWSIALYASKTWTMKIREVKRLDTCNMWLWKRLDEV